LKSSVMMNTQLQLIAFQYQTRKTNNQKETRNKDG